MGDIIVISILAVIAAIELRYIIKKHKNGACSCGCGKCKASCCNSGKH